MGQTPPDARPHVVVCRGPWSEAGKDGTAGLFGVGLGPGVVGGRHVVCSSRHFGYYYNNNNREKSRVEAGSELRQCNVSEVSVKVKTRGVLGADRIKNTRLSSGQLWVDRLAGMLGGCGCGYRARRKIFLF